MLGQIANFGADMIDYLDRHGDWSDKTFGDEKVRGPGGPTKHLKKECDEVLDSISALRDWRDYDGTPLASIPSANQAFSMVIERDCPERRRLVELVKAFRGEAIDLFTLVVDIMRRGLIKPAQMVEEAMVKLWINEKREWPTPAVVDYWDAAPVEHNRESEKT